MRVPAIGPRFLGEEAKGPKPLIRPFGAPSPGGEGRKDRLKTIERHDLAPGPGGRPSPEARGDRIPDEGDVPVAEEDVDAAGVQAARGLPAGVVVGDAVVSAAFGGAWWL